MVTESDNLWTLLEYRETHSWNSTQQAPFLWAGLRHGKKESAQEATFLLPVDFIYGRLISMIRSTLLRCCLLDDQLPFDCQLRLSVPLAGPFRLQVSVLDDDDLVEAMDIFQDAFDSIPSNGPLATMNLQLPRPLLRIVAHRFQSQWVLYFKIAGTILIGASISN